ncbi:hypothetical protein [Methylobacterium trifolii]|uniref:RNA polymerase sigma factor 70 region 4 type 2 domain-containing protein n=1 Tax=Methylobacterium trifolii TaxID=1003092 RepID=A0ABQ4U6W0_9HYPH|nr:hypothetical protein [Methylobacterium trifolii]GJE62607.1 hypothetical protein MPOCJGCO_4740 [Methylobacterium trifolii]
MAQARSSSIDDPTLDCPVPFDELGRISRADSESLPALVDGIPESTRARLAVYLYGRSHTHELGIRIAATCEGTTLRRAAGIVGNVLYDLSRRPYAPPSYGSRASGPTRISLAGSKASPHRV